MNLYWVAAFTTGVIGGLSWWLYGDDRDRFQKGAGGRPSIASPTLGRTAVLLAQYVAPLLIVCCLLSNSQADGMIPHVLLLRFFHPGVARLWASACIGLPGFALFVAAKLALNTNYSPLYSSKVPGDLTATGPYQYIRHPHLHWQPGTPHCWHNHDRYLTCAMSLHVQQVACRCHVDNTTGAAQCATT